MPQINTINTNATTATTAIIQSEKIDPLIRIQEEIREMSRREQEYRQLITANGNGIENENNRNDHHHELSVLEAKDNLKRIEDRTESLSPTLLTNGLAITTTSMASSNDDCNSSMPSSLVMSVSSNSTTSKDDDHHSDDSGISASSTNGVSANIKKFNNISSKQSSKTIKETRYIRPNCYNIIPEPPKQKLLTRAISTPHLNAIKPMRHFNVGPAQKGVMQRFIATRGKLQLHNNNNNNNNINNNNNGGGSLMGLNGIGLGITAPPNTPAINTDSLHYGIINNLTITTPIIERDSEGRPIRPGYVPVELKIQRELQDLKSRENELKKIRKIRESTSDLLNSVDNENVETGDEADDDDDDNVEHCYGPRKLRAAKSIGDMMCDASQHNSLTLSISPMPDFEKSNGGNSESRNGSTMRPAMSLAELCDLDPEVAPSSRGLIAQWESLIQKNA